MLRKLQKRFILIAICAVFVVLTVIMGIINLTNYAQVTSESDKMIAIIMDNGGNFPKQLTKKNDEDGNGSAGKAFGQNDQNALADNNKGGKPQMPMGGMSAEAPFETRYFTVIFDDSGNIVSANTGNIAAITSDEALAYAKRIYSSGRQKGFYNIYRYSVSRTDTGTMVLFLDSSHGLNSYRSFFKTSFAVSLVGFLGVFVIVLLLSKRAIKPIAESYEKQKHFITDASHELKTPLTVINANAEVLEMTNGENAWTKSIHNQVARLTELTDSLVSLARMDERDAKLLMTDFSISDAVWESIAPFRQIIVQQGKTLEESIQKNLSYSGNEESIRKLIGILMDNAIKYSNGGGKIAVSLKSGSKGPVFQICNSVESLEKGNHEEFFERFFRGDASRNSETGGYGIGLSIAKAIVGSHRGRITARSEDGHSLLMRITL